MRGAGKADHVGAGFRNQHLGRATPDPGNAHQTLKHRATRAQRFPNPSADLENALFQVIDIGEKPPDQEGVMRTKASHQRLPERRQFAP